MKILKIYFILVILALASCSLFNTQHYIITPADRQTVRGIQSILVEPPQNYVVDRVDFFIDGVYRSSDNSTPYVYEWNTLDVGNGSRLISVEIYNVSSSETVTDAITVFVDN